MNADFFTADVVPVAAFSVPVVSDRVVLEFLLAAALVVVVVFSAAVSVAPVPVPVPVLVTVLVFVG